MTAAWSLEAEQAVLGSLMIDPSRFDEVGAMIAEADFFEPRHREVWSAIVSLAMASRGIDEIAVHDQLGRKADAIGGLQYLNAMVQSIPSARNVRRYAEIVREKALRRRIKAMLEEAQEELDTEVSSRELVEKIGLGLADVAKLHTRRVPRPLSEILVPRTDHYEALASGTTLPGYGTGIPGLDDLLNGGLRGGKLVFLGARPAIGKTSLAMQILLHQARVHGRPGLFLSQEMTGEELGDRVVSNRGRVDYSRLQTGKLDGEDWSRISEMMDEAIGLPIWVDDQGSLTLADIRSKIRSVPGIKVVVLDYLQLCASTKKGDNRNSEIEEISRGLKALAMELDLTIIALSQLNREVEKRPGMRPKLSDLRDSGSIEQDADVIMFLWPLRPLGDDKLVGCGIDKNRQGRTGELPLHFTGARQHWLESTEPMYPLTDNPKAGGVMSRGFHDR